MIATALNGQRQGRLRSDQLALIRRDAKAAELGPYFQTLHGHTPRSMGRSLPEQRTLTPSILVRIQVPQPRILPTVKGEEYSTALAATHEAAALRLTALKQRAHDITVPWRRRPALHSGIERLARTYQGAGDVAAPRLRGWAPGPRIS